VKRGTTILTDMFSSYRNLENAFTCEHFTVNHSVNYVDPITGAHTNTIEGTWNRVKLCITPRQRTKQLISNELIEFQWRKRNVNNIWGAFLRVLRNVRLE